MKILDDNYKGTIWVGNHPKQVVFDELTNDDCGFLIHIGLGHLTIDVCDNCEKKRCICARQEKSKKKRTKKDDSNKI